jgi:hypothetical protein
MKRRRLCLWRASVGRPSKLRSLPPRLYYEYVTSNDEDFYWSPLPTQSSEAHSIVAGELGLKEENIYSVSLRMDWAENKSDFHSIWSLFKDLSRQTPSRDLSTCLRTQPIKREKIF